MDRTALEQLVLVPEHCFTPEVTDDVQPDSATADAGLVERLLEELGARKAVHPTPEKEGGDPSFDRN